jgi:predicted oxidoreductase (fatty acid repression mutant protein)
MGASLQHYAGFGPAQAAAVTKALGVPAEWSCTAMMPFGVPAGETYPKTFAPIEDRVKVIA